MERKLHIAKDFSLPAEDFIEQATAIIGKRGTGKTGLAKVLMEELSKAKLPFVCFDPIGIAYGLRSSFDGKDPAYEVLVIGGPHGDIRLERRAGAEIAKAIVQANISAIIDFSEEPKASYRDFIRDFSHAIFSLNDSPRVILIDEAPELVPQRLRPDMAATFEAVERLVSRGRNKAIGVVLISQRAATISKDVLTQVDTMFLFGMPSPQDRKAVWEWVEVHGEQKRLDEFEKGIAGLEPREAWVWSPRGDVFKKIRVRDFTTYHPDKTHLRKLGMLETKPTTANVSEIVGKLGKAMERFSKERAETVSMAKAGRELEKVRYEKEALVRELADLKAKVRSLPKAGHPVDPKAIEERAALRVRREYESRLSIIRGQFERVRRALDALAGGLGGAPAHDPPGPERRKLVFTEHQEALIAKSLMSPSMPKPMAVRQPPEPADGQDQDPGKLPAGAMRALKVLAQRYPATFTWSQLATLSGFTPSGGTWGNYRSLIRRANFATEDGDGSVRITESGLEAAGEVPRVPTTHDEIVAMWKRALPSGAGKMLDYLIGIYPEWVTREDLGNATGFAHTGGTFGNYTSLLRRNNLAVIQGQNMKASDTLFPDG